MDQHLRAISTDNALTTADVYFTSLLEEADAYASTELYEKEGYRIMDLKDCQSSLDDYKKGGVDNIKKKGLLSLIYQYQDEEHSADSLYLGHLSRELDMILDEPSAQESREASKKVLLKEFYGPWESHLKSYVPELTKRAKSKKFIRIYSSYDTDKPKYLADFSNLMSYYMEKYGLTETECLELQKDFCSGNTDLPKYERKKIDDQTTEVYEDGPGTYRIIKRSDETEFQEFNEYSDTYDRQIQKKDGSITVISGKQEHIWADSDRSIHKSYYYDQIHYDKTGKRIKSERRDDKGVLISRYGPITKNGITFIENEDFKNGQLIERIRWHDGNSICRRFPDKTVKSIYIFDKDVTGSISFNRLYGATYSLSDYTTINKDGKEIFHRGTAFFRIENGQYIKNHRNTETVTPEEIELLKKLTVAAEKMKRWDMELDREPIEDTRNITGQPIGHISNTQILSQASTTCTPKTDNSQNSSPSQKQITKKTNPTILQKAIRGSSRK